MTKSLTKPQSKTFNNLSTTSSKIRYYLSLNWTKSEIKNFGNLFTKKGDPIRYQHIRNVSITPIQNQK